jgi:predicted DNA-binding transcriptional regulator AlpA
MSEPIELLEVSDLMQLLKISRSAAYRLAESLGRLPRRPERPHRRRYLASVKREGVR